MSEESNKLEFKNFNAAASFMQDLAAVMVLADQHPKMAGLQETITRLRRIVKEKGGIQATDEWIKREAPEVVSLLELPKEKIQWLELED